MAYINAALKCASPNGAGNPPGAYTRGPSADLQFIRDGHGQGQGHYQLQPGFGNLPYHVQQHMVMHAMQLHQLQQMHPQQRQYAWGVQQRPVAQQVNRYEMPHVFGRQQHLPIRQFQQPVQQRAQQHLRQPYDRPVVQQHARYQQPQRQALQPQFTVQQLQQQFQQQQIQQQQLQWQQLQLQQQEPSPQHQFRPQNQRLPQQQPYQQQPYQRQMSVPPSPAYPGVLQPQQLPFAAPVASTATTQQMFNGVAAPASVRSEAVATNGINQMLWANGVNSTITPNFAEMSGGPSNGPKRLDIVTPSHDDMGRAHQLLANADFPIALGNGQHATVRALFATPFVPGQPANIDLQVIRDDGRFRRLYVALTSEAPTPAQAAPVQAVPVPANPAPSGAPNGHVRFNPIVEIFG